MIRIRPCCGPGRSSGAEVRRRDPPEGRLGGGLDGDGKGLSFVLLLLVVFFRSYVVGDHADESDGKDEDDHGG